METVVVYDAGIDGEIASIVEISQMDFKLTCQTNKFVKIGGRYVNTDRILFFCTKEDYEKMEKKANLLRQVNLGKRKG